MNNLNVHPSTKETCRSEQFIVCAWYTPDYAKWAGPLIDSLISAGAPHDILCIPKDKGGWEANTCRKADVLLSFMDRHPGKTIILLDVDCIVRGDLSKLVASVSGDIGFRMAAKWRRRFCRLQPLSGTMVIHPTERARAFVEGWAERSRNRRYGETDQGSLAWAMTETAGVDISILAGQWCALRESNAPDAVIHSWASKEQPKVKHIHSAVHWLASHARRLLSNGRASPRSAL